MAAAADSQAVASAASLQTSAQAAQDGLVTALGTDLQKAWGQLDLSALNQSRLRFAATVAGLVHRYGAASATLAARQYLAQRRAAGIRRPFTVRPAPLPPLAQIGANVGWAISPLYGAEPDVTAAQTNLAGAVDTLVLDVGRSTIVDNARRDRVAKGWARIPEPGACSFCILLATRGAVYKQDTVDFRSHNHCVTGETLVRGPSVEIAYRRWYEGELIIIGTADGQELSVTPNHPVLTSSGWVAAGLITEAHEIVQRAGTDLAALHVPHEHDVPTRIEDVWGTHSMRRLAAVPVTAEHFHRDGIGTNGDVEVVGAHRFLADIVDAECVKEFAEAVGAFARPSSVAATFTTLRNTGTMLVRERPSAERCVGGSRELAACLRSHLLHADAVSHAAVTNGLFGFREPTSYDTASDPETVSELFLGLASGVAADDVRRTRESERRSPLAAGSRFDPASLECEPQRVGMHADLGRALLERLAGGVKLSRPRNLRRVHYSGHVFNLQTAEGWYDAASVVVSNCRCHAEPVFTAYEPSAQIREWQALYRTATAGKSGAAARDAFRKAVESQTNTTT